MRVFADSNIVLYAFSASAFSDRAEAVLSERPIVSAQVLNEFVAVARSKLGFDWPKIGKAINRITSLCAAVSPVSLATHEAARRIAERYHVHIYDATIIASALETDCDTLFTEDMHDGLKVDGRVTIRNPFTRH